MIKKTLIPVAVVLVLIMAFFVFNGDADEKEAVQTNSAEGKRRATLTVTTVKPAQHRLPRNIPANGNIAAWQEAIIGAESNGLMLKDVLVNVGDIVKRGQVLARFNRSTVGADRAQAQANLSEAKMAATEAVGNAERARSIQETGALSKQQMEQLYTAEASAKARVDAAQALLNMQAIKMKQTTVIAPDAGIISSRTATVGAVVSPGTELFKLIRQGRLEWRAELTSADVMKIKPEMEADITLPSGEVVHGKVRIVSPVVDVKTRNAIVFVDLPKSAKQAKLGMFARGNFTLGDAEVMTLPTSAIVSRDGFSYVMLVEEGSQIRQMKVSIGQRIDGMAEVLDLPDTVGNYVASGGAFLVDGDIVKVVEASAEEAKE